MKDFGRRRKQPSSQRSPRIERPKQSIFQYSSNRSQSERNQRGGNPEELTAPPANCLRKYLYRAAFVLVLVGALATSFLGGKPQIVINGGEDLQLRDIRSYQAATDKAIGGWQSYSKLTIDRKKTAEDIKAAYPEIVAVNITTPLFKYSPVVKLELARPAIIISNASNQYALDQRGLAMFDLHRTAEGIDTTKLPSVEDQTGAPIEIGKPALTSGQVNFITEVKHQSEAKKMPLNSVILTAGGGELHIKHGKLPYFVKYNLYEDPRQSFGTFEATREYIDKNNIKPGQYIDVRVPERAYIK